MKKEDEDNGHMMVAASHVPRPYSTWNYALKPA